MHIQNVTQESTTQQLYVYRVCRTLLSYILNVNIDIMCARNMGTVLLENTLRTIRRDKQNVLSIL